MQRLFSNFANGWPGRGLLILRFATATFAFHQLLLAFDKHTTLTVTFVGIVILVGVMLLFVGLWIPIVGAVICVLEIITVTLRHEDYWTGGLIAAVALSIALIGPGTYSVDAIAFGRKRISLQE